MIVDLTATGRTLRENDLEVREVIADSTARLIANRVAHKLRQAEIDSLVERSGCDARRLDLLTRRRPSWWRWPRACASGIAASGWKPTCGRSSQRCASAVTARWWS